MTEAEKIPEKVGLEPEQETELDSLIADFKPEKSDTGGLESSPDIDGEDACKTLLLVVSGIAASWRGDHWALAELEAESVAGPLSAVLDKYIPGAMEAGPEFMLVCALGMVIAPRVMEDKRRALHDGDQSAASTTE